MATKIETKAVAAKTVAKATAKGSKVLSFDETKGIIVERWAFEHLKPVKRGGSLVGYRMDRELFRAADFKQVEKAVTLAQTADMKLAAKANLKATKTLTAKKK